MALLPPEALGLPLERGLSLVRKTVEVFRRMADQNSKVNNPASITIDRLKDGSIVAHVPGADLPFRTDEQGVAWVEAEALGAWVGYKRPADAREMAFRLYRTGILSDSEFFRTVRQTPGERGRPAREHWLTREGALKFAARSDTPRAIALLDFIVRVFVAVLEGRRAANDNATELNAAEVLELRNEIARLKASATTNAYPWGSEARVNLLRGMCATLVKLWCRLDANTTEASERSRVQMKMRAAIGYAPGRGYTLHLLTTDEFERAVRWLYSELADAERRLPKTEQLTLPARTNKR